MRLFQCYLFVNLFRILDYLHLSLNGDYKLMK